MPRNYFAAETAETGEGGVMSLILGDVIDWARHNLGTLLIGSILAYALLFVLITVLFVRQNHLVRKQTRLLRGISGQSMEEMLHTYADSAHETQTRIEQALSENARNAQVLQACLQNVAVIRYDAFGDVGGQQSFSVALLDAQNNGILITGLHGRQTTRLYTKSVEAGQSPHVPLTDEEKQALVLASAKKA